MRTVGVGFSSPHRFGCVKLAYVSFGAVDHAFRPFEAEAYPRPVAVAEGGAAILNGRQLLDEVGVVAVGHGLS